mgnify:CR=1 FL=1
MTDPKDELGERFNDRRADAPDDDAADDNDTDVSAPTSQSATTTNSGSTDTTGTTSTTDNSSNTGYSNTTDSTGKPGPNPDPDSTRNRRQVPMYLPESKANQLNELYDRLDGHSKVAGDGGIEKHADFMETIVELAIDHESELIDRLGIEE